MKDLEGAESTVLLVLPLGRYVLVGFWFLMGFGLCIFMVAIGFEDNRRASIVPVLIAASVFELQI